MTTLLNTIKNTIINYKKERMLKNSCKGVSDLTKHKVISDDGHVMLIVRDGRFVTGPSKHMGAMPRWSSCEVSNCYEENIAIAKMLLSRHQ